MCQDDGMRVDHVSYAAEPDGVAATAARIAEPLGLRVLHGGLHPRDGTQNMIIPLAQQRYVEVVEPLLHPSCDKAPFGQAVRAACEEGGGWLGWVIRVDDISAAERRLGREAVPGHRVFPDGRHLAWRQLGVRGLMNDPQLPFFVEFENPSLHPSLAVHQVPDVAISGLTIAGDPERVRDWLGLGADVKSTFIDFTFIAPHGRSGLMSVTFETPTGKVTI